ncbi:methyltransferase domain-containing protein [Gammaproteobacteria bacterium]|nr:methyltransferase domain-containing protein [Gammaproteobacteria bacterium]
MNYNNLPESSFKFLDPEEIIDSSDFRIIESFLKSTKRADIGWHYIIDLAWIYSIAKDWPRTFRIIDAGGGGGPAQFMLAELGFQVTNIDLILTPPSQSVAQRYGTQHTRLPSHESSDYVQHLEERVNIYPFNRKLREMIKSTLLWKKMTAHTYHLRNENWRATQETQPLGSIDWIQGNLCHMPEIENASFDAVVSLSSLEHIPLDMLPAALKELGRVLKPQACMAMTTSATHTDKTWFHEPSKGNCFTSKDLTDLFNSKDTSALSPIQILEKYEKSDYLRNKLPAFYYASGKNGMPWGEWKPSYIPVGFWR